MIRRSLIVLCVTLASCLAEPSIGYSYTAYAPAVSYKYHPLLYSSPNHVVYSHPPVSYSSSVIVPTVHHPVVHSVAAPVVVDGVKTQYHTQDAHGQAYGHVEPGQSHTAVQDAHGNKIGSFSYVKPDGHVHRTDYVADAAGYRVASNDLPVGPGPAPEAKEHLEVKPVVPHYAKISPLHLLYKRSIYSYPSSHVTETPEVAAAKAAHFAEHAKRGNYHYSYPAPAPAYYNSYPSSHYSSVNSPAPVHAPVLVTPNGHLADTPEVEAAKAAHFAEHAKRGNHYVASVPAHSSPAHQHYVASAPAHPSPVHQPAAHIVVKPDGFLADTPEVAAAKAAHLAEKAKVPPSHDDYNSIEDDSSYYDETPVPSYPVHAPSPAHYQHYSPSHVHAPHPVSYWASPPVITSDGHIADTPEVAHAKAAHLAEYAAVASRHKRSIVLGHTPANTVPLHAPVLYAAPVAHPLVYAVHHPFLKTSSSYTSVVHGPHSLSYTSVHQ